jgi:hypothetical protein
LVSSSDASFRALPRSSARKPMGVSCCRITGRESWTDAARHTKALHPCCLTRACRQRWALAGPPEATSSDCGSTTGHPLAAARTVRMTGPILPRAPGPIGPAQ